MNHTILIIGGYGVFGGRLAMKLLTDTRFAIIVAGRDITKASNFCARHGGKPLALDMQSGNLIDAIKQQAPFVVIDAAGPFQSYPENTQALQLDRYNVARAAIACGSHYLDLSDDAGFTQDIKVLDTIAKENSVTVLSGVSSVPALSSAIVDDLVQDIRDIHLIESVILPGNRAPRGMSVMKAILSQLGQPLTLLRGNKTYTATGWSERQNVELRAPGTTPVKTRQASLIGAPDLVLFPLRYQARSVLFWAGLELKLMHVGLSILSNLVRTGLLDSVNPIAPQLKWLADKLENFGTDRGGMRVRVVGIGANNRPVVNDWTLIAEAGDGPHIPAVAARIMCEKLLASRVPPGSRACLGEFTRTEAEQALSDLKVVTNKQTTKFDLVFEKSLGGSFARLPPAMQDLHTVIDARSWSGEADIIRGKSLFSHIAACIAGFPPAGRNVPVTVGMQRKNNAELWTRNFAGKRFRSRLSQAGEAGSGKIIERFGLIDFIIALSVQDHTLVYPVVAASIFGIPLPRFLLPTSNTTEYLDDAGRVRFDVQISLPLAGHVVSYQGWLESS